MSARRRWWTIWILRAIGGLPMYAQHLAHRGRR